MTKGELVEVLKPFMDETEILLSDNQGIGYWISRVLYARNSSGDGVVVLTNDDFGDHIEREVPIWEDREIQPESKPTTESKG